MIKQTEPLKVLVKSVDPPAYTISDDGQNFNRDRISNYKSIMQHLKNKGRLTEWQLIKIIKMANDLMQKQPNLLSVDIPATVVGDINRQFYI